jgi:murein L,D-transpeptidase YafK
MIMFKKKLYLITLLSLVTFLPWNATAFNRGDHHWSKSASQITSNSIEELLASSLTAIASGQFDQAIESLDKILNIAPNFKLAHLVKGDLLMARAQRFQDFGNPAPNSEDVNGYRDEARKRLERFMAQDLSKQIPADVWQLNNEVPHILLVDAEQSRLFVYKNENETPKYIGDFYITIGKNGSEKQTQGDKKTPLGVYFTETQLKQKLADMYGDAAFPLNYPNEWDKHLGKTGNGIWLHGTPSDTYSRAPQSSDGCIVLSNQDLKTLSPILQQGNIPVIVSKNVDWLKDESSTKDKENLIATIEKWRSDWESQSTDQYLGHYANAFFSNDMNLKQWADYKRKIQASKPNVDIKLTNISAFKYPNSVQNMVVVTFDQSFRSNALNNKMRKRQYWIMENQSWKIVYEGSA